MKLQIVKTDKGYVAISDEAPIKGEYYLFTFNNANTIFNQANEKSEFYKKIVATDTSFKLEGIAQFEFEDNIEEIYMLANKAMEGGKGLPDDLKEFRGKAVDWGFDKFVKGYRAAQEKGCYSIEDIKKALVLKNMGYGEKHIIESLNQPKKLVAIEVNSVSDGHFTPTEVGKNEPLIIANDLYPDGILTIQKYYYD